MRIFIFSLQTALKSIWHEKWINLLTILSISVSLLILSAFVTVTLNVDETLKRWSKSFGLVVYLALDTSTDKEHSLKELFQKDPDVLEVTYISKDQALTELRGLLGSDAPLIEELGENPLPTSFELKLRQELLEPEYVRTKAEQIKAMSGVTDVQYGEKWLSSLHTVSNIMKAGATFLGGAIFIAVIFITYNTIKIFFYRRKEEIETLKLLGATRTFIRMPFLLEGLFIGLLGGAVGSLALFGTEAFIAMKGVRFLSAMYTVSLSLPLGLYWYIPPAGAVMSLIGSLIAVGKIRY